MDASFTPRARPPTRLRVVLFGLGLPALASLAGSLVHASNTTAALLYVVAVVAAAGLAGVWGGLVASILSFLGLNYLFTPPVHTFSVANREDVVALVVFLIVSALVGSLLALSLSLRGRAEGREREARLIADLTGRLRSRGVTNPVLLALADDLVQALPAAGVRIRVDADPEIAVQAGNVALLEGLEWMPIRADGVEAGRVEVAPSGSSPPASESALLRTVADQIGQSIESARLDRTARASAGEAEASRVRAALFGSVTHDLRTPLASIKAAVTSLMDEGVDFAAADRKELLGTILEESDRLNRLVANLLELSRLRAGGLEPTKVPVAIGEVIDGVVGRLRGILGGRDVQTRVREDVPEVWVDAVQMDQAVTNLVENAAKFSPPGSPILISAARWRDGVQVRVVDRGPGIPEADRERVFEAFYRGDADGSRAGTGLGLAIAHAVVAVHGGRIWVEGTPGGGATVVFELPSGAPAGEGAAEPPS